MPIYEYRCETCGETKEVLQKISDPPLTRHADVGSACAGLLTKVMSPPALQFKGSGFYCTDYPKGK